MLGLVNGTRSLLQRNQEPFKRIAQLTKAGEAVSRLARLHGDVMAIVNETIVTSALNLQILSEHAGSLAPAQLFDPDSIKLANEYTSAALSNLGASQDPIINSAVKAVKAAVVDGDDSQANKLLKPEARNLLLERRIDET